MLEYANKNNKPLWQVALDYECSLTGLSHEEVWKVAEETLDISYASIESGHKDGVKFDGITVAKTPEMREKMKNVKLIPTGAADQGTLDALAVMEYSNAHGIIICMPTGGASGIIPATIKNTSKTLGKTKEEVILPTSELAFFALPRNRPDMRLSVSDRVYLLLRTNF